MSIKTKLYLSIVVSIALISFFIITRIILFNAIDGESKRVKLATEVKTAVFGLNILLDDYLLNRTERAGAQWELRYNSGLTILQNAEEEEEEEEEEEGERGLIKNIANDYLSLSRFFKQEVENYEYRQKLISDGASSQELASFGELDARIISQLSIQSQSIISSAVVLEKRAFARLDEIYALTRNSAYLLSLLILFITTVISFKIATGIIKSLRNLQKGTEVVGRGELDYKIDIENKDEIGQVAAAFNEMAAKLQESYSGLEKKVRERTAELQEAKAKDEAILGSIGDAVMACDKDGRVMLFNGVAETLTGFSFTEAFGHHHSQSLKLIRESDGKPGNDFIVDAIKTGQKTSMANHTLLVTKDGRKIPAADSAAPVKNAQGEIIGCVVVFRDVTHEREIDKVKTEFVSLASHQLRTPLSAVNWYTEILLAEEAGKLMPKQKEYLNVIYASNQRMVALVNALLNVSRLELGTLSIEPEPTDIVKLTQSVIDEQKPQIDEKKIKVSSSFEKAIPRILTDPKLLRVVAQNLLSNAVKYTPEGGRIELFLSLDKGKRNLLMKVSDTGYGIPKRQQDKIFSKLFRADNIREKDTDGTGLGLYIVKSIIEQFGGRVWFESEENKGTTFFVTFPLEGVKKKEGTNTLT